MIDTRLRSVAINMADGGGCSLGSQVVVASIQRPFGDSQVVGPGGRPVGVVYAPTLSTFSVSPDICHSSGNSEVLEVSGQACMNTRPSRTKSGVMDGVAGSHEGASRMGRPASRVIAEPADAVLAGDLSCVGLVAGELGGVIAVEIGAAV